jgi:hypothetical protein
VQDKEDRFLEHELTTHIGIELSCNVYNVATETSRSMIGLRVFSVLLIFLIISSFPRHSRAGVLLTPSGSWSQRQDAGVAGVSVRFCSVESAQYVWHVLVCPWICCLKLMLSCCCSLLF